MNTPLAPSPIRSGRQTLSRSVTPSMVARGCGAILVAALAPSHPAAAAALFASGDQARQLCTESQEWCVGFVTGALDGWAALEAYYSGEKFCLPTDLTAGQIVETFKQELDRRPEPRTDPAAYILYEGLMELFPCSPAPDAAFPLPPGRGEDSGYE